MNPTKGGNTGNLLPIQTLAQAIFVVNKHAKTAPQPKNLYELKQKALIQLMKEGKAKKVGLHYSDNPKYSRQQSDVIIECGNYIFHLPPTKEDKKSLPHLGNRLTEKRNPKAFFSLSRARSILQEYLGINPDASVPNTNRSTMLKRNTGKNSKQKNNYPDCFSSTFLGKDLNYYKR